MPFFTSQYGNAHSRTHQYGWDSESAVEHAREVCLYRNVHCLGDDNLTSLSRGVQQVASLISANSKEIIFTSGATESNNMAIKGVARFYKDKKNHIITTQTEHKCVLDSCRSLELEGFKVTYLPVNEDGLIDLNDLREAITPQTSLVSVMAVNNEIGVLQPLKEIGQICRENKVFFHCDMAQMAGKLPVS